jgi:phosphoglucosamine mutase
MISSPSHSLSPLGRSVLGGEPLAVVPVIAPLWSSPHLPNSPLFGTDGIRGRVGDVLTAPLAMQVGFWTAQVLQEVGGRKGAVIIGQDSRNSGNMLAMALSSGLTAAGLEVWHVGLCPTPTVAYLTCASEAIGGVMISASHNPPEDNGIKIFGPTGTKLDKSLQQQIEAGVRGNLGAVTDGCWGQHSYQPALIEQYVAALNQSLPIASFSGMKVVLDLAWGAATQIGPMVFRALGAEVICLHDRPDGDRINVNCGSTHLHRLQETVRESGADMGFAFDGDADRVLAVDNTGRAIDGDYILYLWGKALQSQGKLPGDIIVSTVMSNLGFERAWQAQGGTFVRTSVGDQYVQAEMQKLGAMLGGEQSGHILCRHYGLTGDGVLTAIHMMALVQQAGVSLSELVQGSFRTYPQLLRNVRVVDREKRLSWQTCEPVMAAIAQAERVMGDRGRVLVRASGTEPLIRVMVEAEDAVLVESWTQRLTEVVEANLT